MRYPAPSRRTSAHDAARSSRSIHSAKKPFAQLSKGLQQFQQSLKADGAKLDQFMLKRHTSPGGSLLIEPEDPRPPPLKLDGLECVRTLGQGSFGDVLLVRVRATDSRYKMERPNSLFAVKVICKQHMKGFAETQPDDVHSERARLAELPWSPWINGVIGAFEDQVNLYLALEVIPSGTFHDIIVKRGPFDATTARFYFSNIACGLEFLHDYNVVHRDLKPGNILVKPDGYLAIADFGYARHELNSKRTDSWLMVGTPVYMAPELIERQETTGAGVDWWAAGIILYEMVTKRLPFYGKTEPRIYKRVMSGRHKWPRSIRAGESLKSIVKGLLTVNADQRFEIYTNMRSHPWLKNIDWQKMDGRRYMAPWIPAEPALTQTWLNKSLPEQKTIPGLSIVEPPPQRQFDHRLLR
ncbi:kinase-like domain-containing protein [Hygrophoropsis aurantiaca]|uniref:Kinase-like domain-containing protein n=1 Tax=Hygrophoropsis aurantiaca TaxID=72124 RepID=A0ACB8APP2_9AGAM|nr:kinase-like domain-containing protein [Hygrophoropsis aurantiaca]